ncbi:MAG: hypothetical protein A2Y10_06675 [Planctomycetes bacterium GWF2_41_51]|nr:MAG: hypothetical protein A2Y10_06675 [Planctomycetes bacterium GWF2_41_51]HBG28151.1 hypothetical protein [Phycisphaerales bacterium]
MERENKKFNLKDFKGKNMHKKLCLCFSCASVFEEQHQCPECGWQIEPEQYERIYNYAKAAVYYGIYYRKAYESQLAKSKQINIHYALVDPSEVASFIGVCAVSGIIGQISYNLIQKAFHKIIKSMKGKEIEHDYDTKEINIYIENINCFCKNFEGIDPEIKNLIKDEMIGWAATELFMEELEKDPKIKGKLEESEKKSYKIIREIPRPEDFEKFWNSL